MTRVFPKVLWLCGLFLLASSASATVSRQNAPASGLSPPLLSALSTARVEVTGTNCASCSLPIRRALKALEGVEDVTGGRNKNEILVQFDPTQVTVEHIVYIIEEAGYPARIV